MHKGVNRDSVVICPQFDFLCNARITRVRIRILVNPEDRNNPCIQVWRPTFPDSKIFNKVGEVFVTKDHIVNLTYTEANIPLTGSSRIRVESGDVIGYGHPRSSAYSVLIAKPSGQAEVYEFYGYSATRTLNLDNSDHRYEYRQPLVSFELGK